MNRAHGSGSGVILAFYRAARHQCGSNEAFMRLLRAQAEGAGRRTGAEMPRRNGIIATLPPGKRAISAPSNAPLALAPPAATPHIDLTIVRCYKIKILQINESFNIAAINVDTSLATKNNRLSEMFQYVLRFIAK